MKKLKRLCLNATEIFINNNNINGELSSKLFMHLFAKKKEILMR